MSNLSDFISIGGDNDLTVALGTNFSWSGFTTTLNIDSSIGSGNFGVPLKMNDGGEGDDMLIIAEASYSSKMPCIALHLGTNGVAVTLSSGFIRNDSWSWAPGRIIFVSSGGGMVSSDSFETPQANVDEQAIAVAITPTILYFDPKAITKNDAGGGGP